MSFSNAFGGGYQDMGGGGGGGGFMTDDSPSNMDSSQSKKKQRNMNESMMAVTTAMLHKAEYDKQEEIFKFGDIELHQVTVVGVIREVQESITNMLYKIDDMTADSIIVRKWIEADENPSEAMRRSQYREDSFVRVHGHLKSFQDKRSLVAFQIRPVTDFNEITYHMLDVVNSYLNNTKGKAMLEQANAGLVSPGGFSMTGMTNSIQGGTGDAFGGGRNTGMSTHQQQVLDSIIACQDEQGLSVEKMKQKLRGMSDNQLRSALDFLSNEGHIYSTIDDEHYRSTAS